MNIIVNTKGEPFYTEITSGCLYGCISYQASAFQDTIKFVSVFHFFRLQFVKSEVKLVGIN